MSYLTIALTLVLLHVNLVGLALACRRLFGTYALSRVVAPVAFCLVFFCLEHGVGLGRLNWLWPLTTVVAASLIVRSREVLHSNWKFEAVFLLVFAWAFAWRISYPGIAASSEKLTGLSMISSYFYGDRLPPVDVWLPPFPFDVYYSFQHYCASLMGRILGLNIGLTYNLAVCLIVSLTSLCAAIAARIISKSDRRAALVTVAFVVGGTGATIPVHFIRTNPDLHSSMRFIGGTVTSQLVNTSFGRWLVSLEKVPVQPVQMPMETFSYLLSLGDYHPPLSGFYLLALALLCLAMIESGQETRVSQAVLAGTIPLCIVSNGWSAPFQGLIVLAWIGFRLRYRKPVDWRMLAGGALLTGALCYPFLSTYAYRAADIQAKVSFLSAAEHTPILLGAILLFPVLIIVLLPIAFGERKRWAVWCAGFWILLLVITELILIDDIYSGPYNRFNTTLKWWPWIQAGALLTLGAYCLQSASRVCRYGAVFVLGIVSVYGLDQLRGLITGYKQDFGRLDGSAWITDDKIEKPILEFLKTQPRSIILQRLAAGSFTPSPGMIMFAGHQAFLGWPEHEKLWRGYRSDIELRDKQVREFYAGQLPGAADWLLQNRIEHVLWLKTEDKLPPGTFSKIHDAIQESYYWREFYRADEFRVGLWSRRLGSGHPR